MAWNSSKYCSGIELRNRLLKLSAGKDFIHSAPIEEKNDIHIVAMDDNRVIGTLIISKINDESAQIKQVAVEDGYQGEGIGKKLLEFAEKIAKMYKFRKVFLLGRSQAWGFYVRIGYQSFGQAYYDGVVLLKGFEKEIIQNTENNMKHLIYI